jgi:Mn-dependent DtxR family transcriptional regulator
MSRYDIADYLAVSVETVSRSLTYLKQRGVIKFSGTRIVRIVKRWKKANVLRMWRRTIQVGQTP